MVSRPHTELEHAPHFTPNYAQPRTGTTLLFSHPHQGRRPGAPTVRSNTLTTTVALTRHRCDHLCELFYDRSS